MCALTEFLGLPVMKVLPLDVRGSVNYSTIHKKNPTRGNNVSKFYYFILM
jgi:hypothetical protein